MVNKIQSRCRNGARARRRAHRSYALARRRLREERAFARLRGGEERLTVGDQRNGGRRGGRTENGRAVKSCRRWRPTHCFAHDANFDWCLGLLVAKFVTDLVTPESENTKGRAGMDPNAPLAEATRWKGWRKRECKVHPLWKGMGGGPGGTCTLGALVRRPRPTLVRPRLWTATAALLLGC
jgi:hypothetical protein